VSGETLRIDGAGSLWRKTWEVPEHRNWPAFRALDRAGEEAGA